jgi:hypothetical protein
MWLKILMLCCYIATWFDSIFHENHALVEILLRDVFSPVIVNLAEFVASMYPVLLSICIFHDSCESMKILQIFMYMFIKESLNEVHKHGYLYIAFNLIIFCAKVMHQDLFIVALIKDLYGEVCGCEYPYHVATLF